MEFKVINNPPAVIKSLLTNDWKLYGGIHICNQTGIPFQVLIKGKKS